MSRVVLCGQNLPVPQDPRVWREARTLAQAGHDVTVVAPRSSGSPRHEILEGVAIRRYPAPPSFPGAVGQIVEALWGLFWTALLVFRLLLEGRIDVLHAANPPDTLFLIALMLRPFGTLFVYDQHDPVPEMLAAKLGDRPLLDRALRVLESLSYRSAHLVISISDSCRRLALARSKKQPDQVVVVRIGPDRVIEPEPNGNSALISYAGVMGTQDSVDVVVDAFALLRERGRKDLRLELIGSGDAVSSLRLQAAGLGVDEAITWAGWLKAPQMLDRLAKATLAVSPDVDNPYTRVVTSVKIGEYLALGLPVVVADLPETRVTCGDAVVYFRPGDAQDLADRIDELLDNPSLRIELRRRATERARLLLWSRSAERLVAAYQWLMGAGPPVPGDQSIEYSSNTVEGGSGGHVGHQASAR